MSQVVLSPSPDGHTDLRISTVSAGDTAGPRRGRELHLGSQDLIRFASYAADRGFHVVSFMVADAYLAALSADEEAEVSAEMVEILNEYGGRELAAAMRDDFGGLYVVGVNLVVKASGRRIGVRRRGYVETSTVPDAEQLLQAAWQELQLS